MRLKEIRLEKGLSVPKLSELTGLHRRTIENIERNNDCLVSNAIVLSKALQINLDELCRDSE